MLPVLANGGSIATLSKFKNCVCLLACAMLYLGSCFHKMFGVVDSGLWFWGLQWRLEAHRIPSGNKYKLKVLGCILENMESV